MTREEREKAIDALKISTPIMAMTQEEFNDYIQTLNEVMDWLEQEPKTEKVIKMRDAKPEERESIDKYIKSISKPIRPKGHWICIDDYHIGKFKCSVCQTEGFPNAAMYEPTWNYCPNCGARMEGET